MSLQDSANFKPNSLRTLFEGVSTYHWIAFAGCWLGGIFDGMDSTLMSVVLPTALAQLLHITGDPTTLSNKAHIGQIGAYVTAIFLIGWTLGGVLFGWIGDKYGRVKAMMGSILLYSLFTGLCSVAQSWEQLAAFRFLTGLGIGGELVSIATFLTEVWPAKSRAIIIGLLITSYQAGVFLAGGIHYAIGDWRLTFLLGALPALLVVFIRSTLKESDQWLAATDNQPQEALFQSLFKKQHAKSIAIGCILFGTLLIGYWASLSWIPTWIQSLLPKGYDGNHERSLATMAQAIAAIAGCSSAGFLCNRYGRRKAILIGFVGALIASAWLFGLTNTFTTMVYVKNAMLGYFVGLLQAALYIYLPELFPTRIRATGTGFCLNAGRVLTAIAVLFMGPLVSMLAGYGTAALVFALAYAVGGLILFAAQETHGQLKTENN
ncbi:MAG: MFS transporter [Vampirovibrionales bacterium]|nr:MFS transporter [Vampirovibrionales bacterium]